MDILLESLYRQVFNSALISIGVTDLQGKFVLVNHTWCEKIGYTSEEAQKLTVNDITLHEDVAESSVNYSRLISGEINNFQKLRKYKKKDGSSFWAHLIVSSIKNSEDKIIAIIGIFHDMDEQIQKEHYLREINHSLEEVNEKLIQANTEIHKKNEELQLAYFKLDELARTDKLTGLPNRRQLEEQLDLEVRRTIRSKKEFSICIADIDDFKHINDTYGHDVGDIVLKDLANIIRKSTRTTDIAGRWGGEEFMFILPETDSAGTLVLMERVRQSVISHRVLKDDKVITITLTLGFSTFYIDSNLDEIIKQADLALYAGKKSGKNLAVCYTKKLESIFTI